MIRVVLAALLVVMPSCAADEWERGPSHRDTSSGDAARVDLAAIDIISDAAVNDALSGDTVLRPDAPGDADGLDAIDPGSQPDPDGSEPLFSESHETISNPDPEPQPDVTWPEPQPEVAGPEPQPEVIEVTPDIQPTGVTVYELQTSEASVGCATDASVTIGPVRLDNLVITSPRFVASAVLDGYYAADAGATGPYHGLMLVVPTTLATDFAVGDLVTVEGDHKEYYCMTEVYAASAVQTGVAWEPAPIDLAGWQLAATDPASEPYEGSLVRVSGGTVTLIDSFGEIVVDDTWRIANEFDLAYLLDGGDKAVGDQVLSVTGVVEYSWGRYLVNPRYDSELVTSKP